MEKNMMNRHPFFGDGGEWISEGVYWGPEGAASSFRGAVRVRHELNSILINGEGELILGGLHSVRISNFYRAEKRDSAEILWRSENPVIGTLTGIYFLFEDCILSIFQDEAKSILGSETLLKTGGSEYRVRGVLTKDGAVLSKWALTYKAA
jgi:hypothetical protein